LGLASAWKRFYTKRNVLFGALVGGLFLGAWYWSSGAQARYWNDIHSRRYKALRFRHLPALASFLKRNFGASVETTYGFTLVSHNGDNLAYSEGSIVSNWDFAGEFRQTFTYQGPSIDPAAQEMRIKLAPGFLAKLDPCELRHLANRTKKEGEVSDTFCGMPWFSYFEKNGDLNVTLRIAFPNRWIEDFTEYDRGFSEEMYERIGPMVLRYLRKEVFTKEYVKVEFRPPFSGSPGYVRREPLGTIWGFIFPKKGPPIHLTISTSTSSGKRGANLHIGLHGEGHNLRDKHSSSFLKPEFLALSGRDSVDGLQVHGSVENGVWVDISGDLGDFERWSKPVR
jgi:hypothetical protein